MNSGSDLSLLEKNSEDFNITTEDEQNHSGQEYEDGCSSAERSRRKRLQVPPALLEKETWRSDNGIRRTMSNIECRPEILLNVERSSRNIRRDHEVLMELIAGRDVRRRRFSSTGRESPRLKRYQGCHDLSAQCRDGPHEINENHATFSTLRNLEGSPQSMRRNVTRKEEEFDMLTSRNEEKIISDTCCRLSEHESQEKYQQNCADGIGKTFTINEEEDSSCDSKVKQHQPSASPYEDHKLEVLHINHNFLHTFEGRDSFTEQSDDSMHISDTDYRREIFDELGKVNQERQVLVDKEIEISAINGKATDLLHFDSLNYNGISSERRNDLQTFASLEAQHGKKLRIHEGKHDKNSLKSIILSHEEEYISDEKQKQENNMSYLPKEHGDYISNNSDDCFRRKEPRYSQVKHIYDKKPHQNLALLEEATENFEEVDLDSRNVAHDSLKNNNNKLHDRELREEFSRELHNVVLKQATTESSNNDSKVFDRELREKSPQNDRLTKNNDNGRRSEHRKSHPTRKRRLKRSLSNFELRMRKPIFNEFKNVPANELKEKNHSNCKEAEENDGIQELVGLIEKDAKINERIRDTLHNIDDNISRSKSRHRRTRTKSNSREDKSGTARYKSRSCQAGFPSRCPGCRDLDATIEDMKNQSRQLIQYKREAYGLRQELESILELLEARNEAVDKVCSKYLWLKERKDDQTRRLQQEVFIMEEILGEALTLLECPRCRSLQQLRPTSSRSQPSLVKAQRSRSGFLDTIYRLRWFTEQAVAAKRAKSKAAEIPSSGTNLTDDRA